MAFLFAVLARSEFLKKELLIMNEKNIIPTEIIVGNRIYDILSPLSKDGIKIKYHILFERVIRINSTLLYESGQYLLDNQQYIPVALQGKVIFISLGLSLAAGFSDYFACIYWDNDNGRWLKDLRWLA